ncbi:hypothetical protein Droror1_Dr00020460 [Drosera rotundifolia]
MEVYLLLQLKLEQGIEVLKVFKLHSSKVLVGESLVKQSDPRKGIANLFCVFDWKLRRIGCIWQCGRETLWESVSPNPRGDPRSSFGAGIGDPKNSPAGIGVGEGSVWGSGIVDGDITPRPRTGPMPIPT